MPERHWVRSACATGTNMSTKVAHKDTIGQPLLQNGEGLSDQHQHQDSTPSTRRSTENAPVHDLRAHHGRFPSLCAHLTPNVAHPMPCRGWATGTRAASQSLAGRRSAVSERVHRCVSMHVPTACYPPPDTCFSRSHGLQGASNYSHGRGSSVIRGAGAKTRRSTNSNGRK